MTQSSVFQSAVVDPDIHEWCDQHRLSRFELHFGESFETLLWAGFAKDVFHAWVRRELLSELLEREPLQAAFADPKQAELVLKDWAEKMWGHRLETIYLAQKAVLDRVTCSMIRVKDQCLAFELFQRLKQQEVGFEKLSWEYGEGPERHKGGRFVAKRLQELPEALHPLLRKLKPGEVLKPHRLGEWFVVLSLDAFEPAEFDGVTQAFLLKCELNAWISAVVELLESHIKSRARRGISG